jgi:hypothetical protein
MRVVGLGSSPNPIHLWSDAMNRDNQFNNSSSMAERRKMLREEQASTLFERARVAEQLDSVSYKSAVSGTHPHVDVPAIPSGPWSRNYWQDGPEPPLGYAINNQEPVGTPVEVEHSLAEVAGVQAPTSPVVPGDVVEDGSSHPPPTTKTTAGPLRRLK